MAPLLLITGLVLLAIAGDFLVRGSVSAAQRLRVPPIIIGLTIVAFGTSAPELIVSLEAALGGAPGLAIGNVVGSNISNALLVLGLPAIITPIAMQERGIRRSLVFMIVITLFLIFAARDLMIDTFTGVMLLALLAAYLGYNGWLAKCSRATAGADPDLPEELSAAPLSIGKTLFAIVFGVVGLGVGGKLTTDGALGVAEMFGIADTAVGLTIVALGTSLPELAASLAAALRNHAGVAVGNVIGSNIFNVLGILGITSVVVPLNVDPAIIHFDMWVMLASSAILIPFAFTTRRIIRPMGVVLTLAYLAYVVVAIQNGMSA